MELHRQETWAAAIVTAVSSGNKGSLIMWRCLVPPCVAPSSTVVMENLRSLLPYGRKEFS